MNAVINLNLVDRGTDDATLGYILKSTPVDKIDGLLKSLGFEVEPLAEKPSSSEYESLGKAEIFDLIKARKIKVGMATTSSKGKSVQKVRKRILCHHAKTGKEYYQMRIVNADVAEDTKLTENPLKSFDAHVARVRRETTAHITEEAASVAAMESTPEGKAALDAINAAIGAGSPSGKLTGRLKYTNIRYCKSPVKGVDDNGDPQYYGCVAIAKNPKTGKDQYFYSQQFREAAEAERLQRAMVISSPAMQAIIQETLDSGEFENEDVRDCLKLMNNYGMKSGNEDDLKTNQLGDYITTGATRLTAGNVCIAKKRVQNPETGKTETVEKVFLQFYQQGEKGNQAHQQSIEINDPALATNLRLKKANAASDDTRLFSCTKDDTLAVCKELFDCNNEDLRTGYGFRQWRQARRGLLGNNTFDPKRTRRRNAQTGKMEKLTSKRMEMEIASFIMDQMGVTDKRSVDKYINTKLISLYESNPKAKAKKEKEAKAKAKAAVKGKTGAKKPKPKPKKPTDGPEAG